MAQANQISNQICAEDYDARTSLTRRLRQDVAAMPCCLPQRWNRHVGRPHAQIVVQAYYGSVNGRALRLLVDTHFTVLLPVDPRVTCQLIRKLCLSIDYGADLMQVSIGSGLSPSEKEQAMEALLPVVVFGRLANVCSFNTICSLSTPIQQALVSTILFLPVDPRWPLIPHWDAVINYGMLILTLSVLID